MRQFAFIALLFTAACGGSSSTTNNLPPGTTLVDMQAGATGRLTAIRFGQYVAWRSVDGQHHSISLSGMPADSSVIDVPAGEISTAVHFTAAGDHQYFCSIHGQAAENGTVHVLPPGS